MQIKKNINEIKGFSRRRFAIIPQIIWGSREFVRV